MTTDPQTTTAPGEPTKVRTLAQADNGDPDPRIVEQLHDMGTRVVAMVELALRAVEERGREVCLAVASSDAEVDALHDAVFTALSEARDDGSRRWALSLDRVARYLERAGDHAVDIAEAVWFQITGEWREFGRDR